MEAQTLDDTGRGVGEVEGIAVAVADLLPGESAEVIVEHRSPNAPKAWARLLARTSPPSPQRVAPLCRAHGACGGCAWQHASASLQLAAKRAQVLEALDGLCGADELAATIAAPTAERYRNRGNYVVRVIEGRTRLGAYAPGTHDFVSTTGCAVVERSIDWLAGELERRLPPALVARGRQAPGIRFVSLRTGDDGAVLVGLVASSATAEAGLRTVATELLELRTVSGCVWIQNDLGSDVIVAGNQRTLAGAAVVTELVAGVPVELGLGDFTQVNRQQADRLYQQVAELALAGGHGPAVDLYCGVGGFAFAMAERGASVIAIERNPRAIEAATRAAAQAGLASRLSFVADDAAAISLHGGRPEVVVVDPPRKGLDERARAALLALGVRRIVYVSCGPSSLARDLRALLSHGYRLTSVTPWDLMPGTSQVEVVAVLERDRVTA